MMKAALLVALLLISTMAQAQRINETKDEARQRQQSEQYQQYQNRGNQEPLGGYQQRLGDPPQRPLNNDAYGSQRPATPYTNQFRFDDE